YSDGATSDNRPICWGGDMTPTSTIKLQFGAKSVPGLVREENQDRMTQFSSPLGEIFVVADGMGGHLGGATAATAVVQGMQRHLSAVSETTPLADALEEACRNVNANVCEQGSAGDASVAGMGSTILIAVLTGEEMVVAHIGDSRAYLFRNGQLK